MLIMQILCFFKIHAFTATKRLQGNCTQRHIHRQPAASLLHECCRKKRKRKTLCINPCPVPLNSSSSPQAVSDSFLLDSFLLSVEFTFIGAYMEINGAHAENGPNSSSTGCVLSVNRAVVNMNCSAAWGQVSRFVWRGNKTVTCYGLFARTLCLHIHADGNDER